MHIFRYVPFFFGLPRLSISTPNSQCYNSPYNTTSNYRKQLAGPKRSIFLGSFTCRFSSRLTVRSSDPDRKPCFVDDIALIPNLLILRFQAAEIRILLCKVGQTSLECRIESIDAVGFVPFAGQDDGLFFVFRQFQSVFLP